MITTAATVLLGHITICPEIYTTWMVVYAICCMNALCNGFLFLVWGSCTLFPSDIHRLKAIIGQDICSQLLFIHSVMFGNDCSSNLETLQTANRVRHRVPYVINAPTYNAISMGIVSVFFVTQYTCLCRYKTCKLLFLWWKITTCNTVILMIIDIQIYTSFTKLHVNLCLFML